MGLIHHYLSIKDIKIHNANAFPHPLYIGFPAITAWLGGVHALQRLINEDLDCIFTSTAIINHEFKLQTQKSRFSHKIINKGIPLQKTGERSPIVAEPRCHLTISLIIQFKGIAKVDENKLEELVKKNLHRIKLASGDIIEFASIDINHVDEDDEPAITKFLKRFVPGYAIIDRSDLLRNKPTNKDQLDHFIDHLAIHNKFKYEHDTANQKSWQSSRLTPGWIVPLAVGFNGLSKPSIAKYQRDSDTPHLFGEAILSLGEFIMPHRISNINEILWQEDFEEDHQLYLCKQLSTLE